MQASVPGFRCRAALRETVTSAALRYLSQNGGGSVVIFAVMGGYEARTPERGAPSGSHTQLEIVTAAPPPASAAPPDPPVPVNVHPPLPPVTNEQLQESARASVEGATVGAQPDSSVVPIVPGKPAKRGKAKPDGDA